MSETITHHGPIISRTFTILTKEGQQYIEVPCQWCPTKLEVPIIRENFDKWIKGDLIQNAMPELSANLREILMSGTCPKCWDEMFPPEA